MQTLLPLERIEMHPIKVTAQLEKCHKSTHQENHKFKQPGSHKSGQQQGVEAKHKEVEFNDNSEKLATLLE